MKKSELSLSVQYATEEEPPSRRQVRSWVRATLAGLAVVADIGIRFVDREDSRLLNRRYRGKNCAANVLSFAYGGRSPFMGDIVICCPIVRDEAARYRIPLLARHAHMIVHGSLHLLGYAHDTPHNASKMEARETAILARCGYGNPYQIPS